MLSFQMLTLFITLAVSPNLQVRGSAADSSDARSQGKALNALGTLDGVSERLGTIKFQIEVPCSLVGPDVGPHTKFCAFTSLGDSQLLTIITEYGTTPRYHQPGQKGAEPQDYDDDGNMLVSRSIRKDTIGDREGGVQLVQHERFRIAPDGRILDRAIHRRIYTCTPRDCLYELDQFLLATGRGFYRHLHRLDSEVVENASRRKWVASGGYGPGLEGIWTLSLEEIDKKAIVRTGELKTNGVSVLRIDTKGTLQKGEAIFASEGTINFLGFMDAGYELRVKAIEISERADEGEVKRVRDSISRAVSEEGMVIRVPGMTTNDEPE